MTLPFRHLALALSLASLSALVAAPVSAQEAAFPGDRIRIMEVGADSAVEARLMALTGNGVAFQPYGGVEMQLPPRSVELLEVRARSSRWARGLVLGALAGGAIGAIWVPTDDETECTTFCVGVFDRGDERLFSGIGGAIVGSLAGGLIGSFIRTESWEPVIVPWRIGDGMALGVRLSR